MNPVVIRSTVGSDGTLRLTIPVGPDAADKDVRVTVEPADDPATAVEEWRRCILDTAGKWQGELVRPPQGEYERRDPLS
jgi:hypothetical protein